MMVLPASASPASTEQSRPDCAVSIETPSSPPRACYHRVVGRAGSRAAARKGAPMTTPGDSGPGSRNLAVLAQSAFERLGDYESLVFEGRAYRSGELFDRACRASTGLARLGVMPGDRVVVLMANCPEVGICYNAIWRAGAV